MKVKFDPKDYTQLSENFKCIVDVTMNFNRNILERIEKLTILLSRSKCIREYNYIYDKIEEIYYKLSENEKIFNKIVTDDVYNNLVNNIKLAEEQLPFLED